MRQNFCLCCLIVFACLIFMYFQLIFFLCTYWIHLSDFIERYRSQICFILDSGAAINAFLGDIRGDPQWKYFLSNSPFQPCPVSVTFPQGTVTSLYLVTVGEDNRLILFRLVKHKKGWIKCIFVQYWNFSLAENLENLSLPV